MPRRLNLIVVVCLFNLVAAPVFAGQVLPIQIDGGSDDWSGSTPLAVDARERPGDNQIDFGAVHVANDDDALYVRLEVGAEIIFQTPGGEPGGHSIILYLDADSDPATGAPRDGLGVDLEIDWGARRARWHRSATDYQDLTLNEAGTQVGPTHSAAEFEMRVPFSIRPGLGEPVALVPGAAVRFFFEDSAAGDRLPDAGALSYELSADAPPPVAPIALERMDAGDVRLLCHNVLRTGMAVPQRREAFVRYLRALRPDIVCFQEVDTLTAEECRAFIAEALAEGPHETWQMAKETDCMLISRWPILASDRCAGGNLAALIDLPDERFPVNLVVFNAHTPCCANNEGRDAEHDAIAAAWRDMLDGKGLFPTIGNEAVAIVGDLNMVGFARQLHSIRDGDLVNNETAGPDFAPGRGEGSLRSAPLRHTHSRNNYTWRDDRSEFAPGKLDYILYSGDALTLKRNYALWTPDMPDDVLEKAGLQHGDSPLLSDHLVLIADFAPASQPPQDFAR